MWPAMLPGDGWLEPSCNEHCMHAIKMLQMSQGMGHTTLRHCSYTFANSSQGLVVRNQLQQSPTGMTRPMLAMNLKLPYEPSWIKDTWSTQKNTRQTIYSLLV